MRKNLIGTIAATTLLISSAALADGDEASPREFHIVGTPSYGGTGCPQGTMTPIISADGTAMTLIFDQYVAELGPGIPRADNRRNCVVNLNVHVPQGFTFAIGTVDYAGAMSLDKGVDGKQTATYWFMGDRVKNAKKSTTFKGPKPEASYVERDEFELASLVWSPCGITTNFNIQSELNLVKDARAASNAQGFITTDTIDGKFTTKFNFRWERCRE